MLLIEDEGADAVALTRTITTVSAFPKTLRAIAVPLTDVQAVPPFRLYSIELVTPVIAFCVLLNTAFGAAARAGTVTVIVADLKAVSVAL